MPLVAAYHRPTNLDEAIDLLSGPGRVPLAGGTVLNADRRPSRLEVVDLQALGLTGFNADGTSITMGAMVRLDTIMQSVDGLLAEAARRELPSTLRTLATVGGTVGAANPDSVLLAAMLVSECIVSLSDGRTIELDRHLWAAHGLIVSTTVDIAGEWAIESTGRTPKDTPIVAAIARRTERGTTLALTGVAQRPILVDPTDPTAGLAPPDDFRGSSEYRVHLAATLSRRALEVVS